MCSKGEMRTRMLTELRRELAERRAARGGAPDRARAWPAGVAGAGVGCFALIALLAL